MLYACKLMQTGFFLFFFFFFSFACLYLALLSTGSILNKYSPDNNSLWLELDYETLISRKVTNDSHSPWFDLLHFSYASLHFPCASIYLLIRVLIESLPQCLSEGFDLIWVAMCSLEESLFPIKIFPQPSSWFSVPSAMLLSI